MKNITKKIKLPDLINGMFEVLGAPFIVTSIIKLHSTKVPGGVSIMQAVFFFMWGLWNLYYYPSLKQKLSFYGGVAILIANAVWMAQLIYYTYFFN